MYVVLSWCFHINKNHRFLRLYSGVAIDTQRRLGVLQKNHSEALKCYLILNTLNMYRTISGGIFSPIVCQQLANIKVATSPYSFSGNENKFANCSHSSFLTTRTISQIVNSLGILKKDDSPDFSVEALHTC